MPLIGRGWNPKFRCGIANWNSHALGCIGFANNRHIECCQVQHQPIQFQLGIATEILNNPMVIVRFDGELQGNYTSKT